MVRLGFELKQHGSGALSATMFLQNMPMLEHRSGRCILSTTSGPLVEMIRLWLHGHTSSLQSALAVDCSHTQL